MSAESGVENLSYLMTFLEEYTIHQIQTATSVESPSPKPVLNIESSLDLPLNNLIRHYNLSDENVLLILIALAPHLQPGIYDNILAAHSNGGAFPEFGGFIGKGHRGVLPTAETAMFILAGNDITRRIEARKLFDNQNFLFKTGILSIGLPQGSGEPRLSGQLLLDEEYIELLTTGIEIKPDLSPTFPAELINTNMEWSDLILQDKTLNEVKEIETWLEHNETLLSEWDMGRIIKPGYRVMFYGPPGTGKTLTASLLGKYTGRDVYRIDLSMVVSKYIGETEKNLSSLFNKAQNKDWILFFDEADAIFGKRTNVRDAHDKYANQEVSYLLQRIEAHPGLVILASNFKSNIDEAFSRRFHCIIEFALPAAPERQLLWEACLPKNIELADDVSLDILSERYELTGANIVNAIHYACLKQLEQGTPKLRLEFIVDGIKKEYRKEGKTI